MHECLIYILEKIHGIIMLLFIIWSCFCYNELTTFEACKLRFKEASQPFNTHSITESNQHIRISAPKCIWQIFVKNTVWRGPGLGFGSSAVKCPAKRGTSLPALQSPGLPRPCLTLGGTSTRTLLGRISQDGNATGSTPLTMLRSWKLSFSERWTQRERLAVGGFSPWKWLLFLSPVTRDCSGEDVKAVSVWLCAILFLNRLRKMSGRVFPIPAQPLSIMFLRLEIGSKTPSYLSLLLVVWTVWVAHARGDRDHCLRPRDQVPSLVSPEVTEFHEPSLLL